MFYGYKLIFVNEQYSKLNKTYFVEDDIDKCLYDIMFIVKTALVKWKENLINLFL